MTTLLWLILGHLVADYPLQTDFVAKYKNRHCSLAAVPWYYVLAGHAATHAAAVGIITGSPLLALLELVAHAVIDATKCEGWTTIHTDQFLHLVCKVAWAGLVVMGMCGT